MGRKLKSMMMLGLAWALVWQTTAAQEVVAADPAVWGPYAKLVGRTFAGEDVSGWPNYAAKSRSVQWEEPGRVMVESGVQSNGKDLPTMRILPGKQPGELLFDVPRAPNATGRVVDADTLVFDQAFGYESSVHLVDAGFEMKVVRRGEVQAMAIYRDTASDAYAAHAEEQVEKAAADKVAARAALREKGVPAGPLIDAPSDRVLAYQEPVRGPSGTLQVTRGKAWEAGACYAAVYINGRWAARLQGDETAHFIVPAGDVEVAVASDPQGRGTCRFGQSTQEVHETVLAKGESVHVYFVFSGGVQFSEAAEGPAPAPAPLAP
ncbi:hypothetical protein [Pseudoxanthomonas dokdonensis]|uniref:hypothetical protein n=1 Tax=Pseudoxanthomonas dokdonensis TaxID=344882 RepID=UPI00070936BE|nr:hypothetical protein [Pseudoxanthomonas dokdonensis]